MDENLLTISQAAKKIGISVDTLRRWDKSGKLVAIRKQGGVHRYYREKDLEVFMSDLFKLAQDWNAKGLEIPPIFYSINISVFQSRLIKMQEAMTRAGLGDFIVPLITAVTGEIGNNSFDHNLGKWPDVQGIFFGYDINMRQVVLADRGLGILATLSRVRPDLKNHTNALRVAFTEIISGRAPEKRGNGLKFVRQVVAKSRISLFFTSGDAELRQEKNSEELNITRSAINTQGCFAIIKF